MAREARAVDYNFDTSAPSVAGERAGSTPASGAAPRTALRSVDASAVPEFLQLLARAVQQFHTYPSTSPLCRNAIEAAQRARVQMPREQLAFRVAPAELISDELPVGRGTIIETELAHRLHAAGIAEVTIEQSVSQRELAHFAADLIACSHRDRSDAGLTEMLVEHGVDRIALRQTTRPEVLPVATPAAPLSDLITYERQRREALFAAGGHAEHLYPPDKGWVRFDPAASLSSVSLTDLALLAESPSSLASMLVRLTDDDDAEVSGDEALSQKFSDVAMLFSALDPRVARVMLSKLARAVLDLGTEQRQALLRRTILPSLLDGRIDGTVLRDFPDVDLAEALCLLLDLETAAPEVVMTALARLDLDAARESAVVPLIEERLQSRAGSAPDLGLDAHARRLIRVDQDRNRSFAEFAAFDLSLDAAGERALMDIRERIAASDLLIDQIACLCRLTRLEPNPEVVQRFLALSEPLFAELERQQRWGELADWLLRYRELADASRDSRPDVAEMIAAHLAARCTARQAETLLDLATRDEEGRAAATRLIPALGPPIGPALLSALRPGEDGRDDRTRAVVQIVCDHAALVAPALAQASGSVAAPLARLIARVLGFAGAGYEAALGAQLDSRDEQTVRETLRSLARIGTPQAAALVAAQVVQRRDWVASAAEQTLWHFPPAEAEREVRSILSRRDFLLQQPAVAARLLDRMVQRGTTGLESMLRSTVALQYRFWNLPQMRLGRKARALLNQ